MQNIRLGSLPEDILLEIIKRTQNPLRLKYTNKFFNNYVNQLLKTNTEWDCLIISQNDMSDYIKNNDYIVAAGIGIDFNVHSSNHPFRAFDKLYLRRDTYLFNNINEKNDKMYHCSYCDNISEADILLKYSTMNYRQQQPNEIVCFYKVFLPSPEMLTYMLNKRNLDSVSTIKSLYKTHDWYINFIKGRRGPEPKKEIIQEYTKAFEHFISKY
jgi:hypothetical protein